MYFLRVFGYSSKFRFPATRGSGDTRSCQTTPQIAPQLVVIGMLSRTTGELFGTAFTNNNNNNNINNNNKEIQTLS